MSQDTWMQGFVLNRKEPASDQKNGCEHAMHDQVLNQKRFFRFILQFDFPPRAIASLLGVAKMDATFGRDLHPHYARHIYSQNRPKAKLGLEISPVFYLDRRRSWP